MFALSLGYSGLLYAASLKAGFLDVRSPYWVVSAGGLLLLSPVYHGVILPAIASALRGERIAWRGALRPAFDRFARLFLGELVVGAAVIVGALLLVLPGVYIGMRWIYYKQAIVLGGMPLSEAVRESIRKSRDGPSTVRLFVSLAGLYGCAVGLDALLVRYATEPVVHLGAVVATALALTWMNVVVTSQYTAPQAGET